MKLNKKRVFEYLIGVAVGLISVLIFVVRSGWNSLNINQPLSYFADPIYYANLVRNAQSGSVLLGSGLGAPQGQQYGLSAYGFEWIQSHFIALFASAELGPWLALNRFSIYTFFMTGFCCYVAFRWMKIDQFPATLGAVAFTLIPNHQVLSPGLGNMSALVLIVGIIWKLASGLNLNELFFARTNNRVRTKNRDRIVVKDNFLSRHSLFFNTGLLFVICLFQLTSALYYIMFTTLLGGSLLLYFIFRRHKLIQIKATLVFLTFQVATMLIALLPIILGRFLNNLPFSEPSTGDRRPFAAYANGGDLYGIFSPFSANSLYYRLISKVPTINGFYAEYFTSPITLGSEYIFYPSGFVFVALLTISVVIVLGPSGKYKGLASQITPFIVLIVLTIGWYLRGGFGTYFSFLFPYVRGYARFSAIMIFMGIALLCYFSSWKPEKSFRNLSFLLLLVVFIDTVSNIPVINQNINKSEIRTVGEGELAGSSLNRTEGITLRTLGYLGTKELVKESEKVFNKNCSIAVLPLASFMVDFNIGITSYYTLEFIKPGLEPSTLKWSSGGITGTPNNAFTDRNLANYQSGNYEGLLKDVESSGFCGVLIFRDIQNAFHEAGPRNGSNYGSSDALIGKLIDQYGKPCYSDLDSAVDLFCIRKESK
jgi:hypothetical protein